MQQLKPAACYACCCCCHQTGRHPLTELLTDGRFIPNDTCLGMPAAETTAAEQQQQQGSEAAGPRMILITGPNASGKSVYMKQVGCLGASVLLYCNLSTLNGNRNQHSCMSMHHWQRASAKFCLPVQTSALRLLCIRARALCRYESTAPCDT